MKLPLLFLFGNVPTIVCVGIAGALALNDKPGWGWFLAAACLVHATIRYNSDKDE